MDGNALLVALVFIEATAIGWLLYAFLRAAHERDEADKSSREYSKELQELDRKYSRLSDAVKKLQDENEELRIPHMRCSDCKDLVSYKEALESEDQPNVWTCLDCLPVFCNACGELCCNECGGCLAPCRRAKKNDTHCECEEDEEKSNVIAFPGNKPDHDGGL